MPSRSFGVPSRREGPQSIWDTHGISGNVFVNPDASSSAPYPQELRQWNSSMEEPLHSSTVDKSERQKQDQDLRCQSGPSAKNSVIFSEPDITQDVISVQTCPSEENKSVRVEQTHDGSGKPDKHNVAIQDDPEVYHEIKMLNTDNELISERIEEDMDFRIPGQPHSVVKHAQSTSVRELSQKIENHPDRHALQQDLRPNQSYDPFSPESKKMIQDVGNIELCELLETEPKTQCKACLSYWNIGIVYCTCGHFLHKETGVNRKFVKYTMDLLSVPEYVIKKGRLH